MFARRFTGSLLIWLATLAFIHPTPIHAACSDYPKYWAEHRVHCWDDFGDLRSYLSDPTRRSTVFRIVQPRNGREALSASHNQYHDSCFFFSIAPILEHLGYARFERLGHYGFDMAFLTSVGPSIYPDLDVGYFGSPEHLMATYVVQDTLNRGLGEDLGLSIYPCGFFQDDNCDDLTGSPRSQLNQNPGDCKYHFAASACNDYRTIFDDGTEYGFCIDLSRDPTPGKSGSVDKYEKWLNSISTGCGTTCSCSPDADCGSFWFQNRVLVSETPIGGCNDALSFNPGNAQEETQLRRIIKGFIDHNLPLLVGVDDGHHFMTLIGYADLDEDGLPCTAILADPVFRTFWTSSLKAWGITGRNDERWALTGITPWNQHLDSGCEEGGWAKTLDDALPTSMRSRFQLCRTAGDEMLRCVDRYYGIQLTCEDDGRIRSQYHAYVEDPFITEPRGISCDKVTLRYADGSGRVESATINRYLYSTARRSWDRINRYEPNRVTVGGLSEGRAGSQSLVVWDGSWPDDYWLVAQGLPAPNTQRRTTIELTLTGGSQKRIEITPPSVYGIAVDCIDEGRKVAGYFAEADHEVFMNDSPSAASKQFFSEDRNLSCDTIEVRVALGYGSAIAGAEIERQYYAAGGRWLKANTTAPWAADEVLPLSENLTGAVDIFRWTASWFDDLWLVADQVGSGAARGSRKTIIRLRDRGGMAVREIEIVPLVEEPCRWELPMAPPIGGHLYSYKPLGGPPIVHPDPALARPLAVGSVAFSTSAASVSDTVTLRLGAPRFTSRVDIYIGFAADGFPGIWLLTADPMAPIRDLARGMVPWATNTIGDAEVTLLPDIPESALPDGRYHWVVLVVPAGATRFDDHYLWFTYFDVRRDCSL